MDRIDRARSWPIPLTPLVGREREIAEVRALLGRPGTQLLVLTGAGGVGKTRVAAAAAEGIAAEFTGGVYFVDLSGVRDPNLVIPTVAHTLGLTDDGPTQLSDRLLTYLRDREILLVLDNLEQVADAAPDLADLLRACPRLRILATSRRSLNVSPEIRYPVSPLQSPGDELHETEDNVSGYPAVELFLQRARAIDPGFDPGDRDLRAVSAVCARLGGLPLAIELAAVRTAVLTPTALLERLMLQPSLQLLTGGPRDLPERHRTMRATVAWSYELLPAGAQQLFRRLSVCAGGFTLDTVEGLGGAAIEDLSALTENSLVQRQDGHAGPRFTVAEPVREYGIEQLGVTGEADAASLRHAEHFARLASEAEVELAGADQRRWLDRLDDDFDNLRAAVRWSLDHQQIRLALCICAVWPFFLLRGHLAEGWAWVSEALSLPNPDGAFERISALRSGAHLSVYLGEYARAVELARESLNQARPMGDERELAASLTALGLGLQIHGDRIAANRAHDESIALCRAAGDRRLLARALLISALNRRGDVRSFEESLRLFRESGDRWGEASVLHGRGTSAMAQKRWLEAWDHFAEGLQAAAALDHGVLMVMHLDGLSAASMGQRRFRDGARMLAAADALRTRIGVMRTPGMQEARSRSLTQAERALGGRILAEALAEGESLTVAEILASFARRTPAPVSEPSDGLTRRELEILRLVAEGLTNAEMANRLVISVRTIDAHLVSVYGKLGISSRSAATRYAIEQGLVELGT